MVSFDPEGVERFVRHEIVSEYQWGSNMHCLVCMGPLEAMEGDQWRCPECRFVYPREVLGDPLWGKIATEGLYCLLCEQAIPDMPRVHVNRKGEPIPCPIHAYAPRRSWWQRWRRARSDRRVG